MIALIAKWTGLSLLFGPLAFVLLGLAFIPLMGPGGRLWVVLPAYLLYWGAGAVLVSLILSPVIVVLYSTWAVLCRRVPGLDEKIFACAVPTALAAGALMAFSWEDADAKDVGREFSIAYALGTSLWLSLSVWVGIVAPRRYAPSLKAGVLKSAA